MKQFTLEKFINQFNDFSSWENQQKIDYLTFFIQEYRGQISVTGRKIDDCFSELSLKKPSNTAVYLSKQSKAKEGKYIKRKLGYELERTFFNNIKNKISNEPKKIQASDDLNILIPKIKDEQEKSFLEEAINCYRVSAFRATIILVWILTIDHMQKHVFNNSKRLNDFNFALKKNPEKKLTKIQNYDDFSDLKESSFIKLMRSAKVINNDVQKILKEKLDTRNSAGHPSSIIIGEHKATEFILDLTQNVLLKFV